MSNAEVLERMLKSVESDLLHCRENPEIVSSDILAEHQENRSALTAAISMMEGWVSVETALPDESEKYFVVCETDEEKGLIGAAHFHGGDWYFDDYFSRGEGFYATSFYIGVTHWKKPQPPEADQ